VKRRKLYRQATGDQQVWFPFEMAVATAQELVWEAGGNDYVKWVFHGTPGAGNAVLGTTEMNANAIVLCEDDHHKEHFKRHFIQKAAERVCAGQARVFTNPFLAARVLQLFDKDDSKSKKKTKDKEKQEEKKEEKKEEKEKKEKKEEKKEKKEEKKEEQEEKKDKPPKKTTLRKRKAPKKDATPKKDAKKKKAKESGSSSDDANTGSSSNSS